MTLLRRSLTSAFWHLGSNASRLAVLFVRAVVLARLLPVEVFGTYAFASSLVVITSLLGHFGIGAAFVHRAPETRDEPRAASVQLSLTLLLSSGWIVLLGAAAFLWTDGALRTALLVIGGTRFLHHLADVPRAILVRRVMHGRLAVLQTIQVVAHTAAATGLAVAGFELLALLAINIVNALVLVAGLWLWRPVHPPRLAWDGMIARYYLRFGSQHISSLFLRELLDRLDNVWTAVALGQTALGLYSRAYRFGTYPADFLARPVAEVSEGTFAEVEEDRRRRSKAFYRTMAFLVRTGFFLSGWLFVVAPELIVLLIGPRWLPMLPAFRVLLAFSLLRPLLMVMGRLFTAIGRPGFVVGVHAVQLSGLIVGLLVLTEPLGIAGVALSVSGMSLLGAAALLLGARRHVDYSLLRLLAWPSAGLLAGLLCGFAGPRWAGLAEAGPLTLLLGGSAAFATPYVLLLLLTEWRDLRSVLRMVRGRRPGGPTEEGAP